MTGFIFLIIVVAFVAFALNDFKLDGIWTNFTTWISGIGITLAAKWNEVGAFFAGLF
jgi:hypothetical protein